MRHRPGDVGLTARATTQQCTQIGGNGLSAPFWGVCVHCCNSRGSCERPWGRRSVHRSAKMASRSRFGAFVYTVATRVAMRIATRAAPGGTSASATTACRRRPLAGPSRLVGKIGSARVAPLPGWRLRRGVNPHEPLKSLRLQPVKGPVSTDKPIPMLRIAAPDGRDGAASLACLSLPGSSSLRLRARRDEGVI